MGETIFEEAHSAVAVGIAERFTCQPHSMAWEDRCDELATAAIEAMQIFIQMRRVDAQRIEARQGGDGTAPCEAREPGGEAMRP